MSRSGVFCSHKQEHVSISWPKTGPTPSIEVGMSWKAGDMSLDILSSRLHVIAVTEHQPQHIEDELLMRDSSSTHSTFDCQHYRD